MVEPFQSSGHSFLIFENHVGVEALFLWMNLTSGKDKVVKRTVFL